MRSKRGYPLLGPLLARPVVTGPFLKNREDHGRIKE